MTPISVSLPAGDSFQPCSLDRIECMVSRNILIVGLPLCLLRPRYQIFSHVAGHGCEEEIEVVEALLFPKRHHAETRISRQLILTPQCHDSVPSP